MDRRSSPLRAHPKSRKSNHDDTEQNAGRFSQILHSPVLLLLRHDYRKQSLSCFRNAPPRQCKPRHRQESPEIRCRIRRQPRSPDHPATIPARTAGESLPPLAAESPVTVQFSAGILSGAARCPATGFRKAGNRLDRPASTAIVCRVMFQMWITVCTVSTWPVTPPHRNTLTDRQHRISNSHLVDEMLSIPLCARKAVSQSGPPVLTQVEENGLRARHYLSSLCSLLRESANPV